MEGWSCLTPRTRAKGCVKMLDGKRSSEKKKILKRRRRLRAHPRKKKKKKKIGDYFSDV